MVKICIELLITFTLQQIDFSVIKLKYLPTRKMQLFIIFKFKYNRLLGPFIFTEVNFKERTNNVSWGFIGSCLLTRVIAFPDRELHVIHIMLNGQ